MADFAKYRSSNMVGMNFGNSMHVDFPSHVPGVLRGWAVSLVA